MPQYELTTKAVIPRSRTLSSTIVRDSHNEAYLESLKRLHYHLTSTIQGNPSLIKWNQYTMEYPQLGFQEVMRLYELAGEFCDGPPRFFTSPDEKSLMIQINCNYQKFVFKGPNTDDSLKQLASEASDTVESNKPQSDDSDDPNSDSGSIDTTSTGFDNHENLIAGDAIVTVHSNRPIPPTLKGNQRINWYQRTQDAIL